MAQIGAWTEDDWEEYWGLPWLGRKMADVIRFIPATERCLVPLIGLHARHAQRRSYEKAHRRAPKQNASGGIPSAPTLRL